MTPPGGAVVPDVLTLLDATQRGVRLVAVAVGARAATSGFLAGIQVAAIRVAPPLVDGPADGGELPCDWGAVLPGTDRVELAPVTVDVQADRVSDFGGYP